MVNAGLAYVSPLGRALVDKRLYLPKSWIWVVPAEKGFGGECRPGAQW